MKKICIYLIEWYQKHISKFFVANITQHVQNIQNKPLKNMVY